MKAFFSVIREIKEGKGDTVTKILSLTIGRVVRIVVLAYNLSVYSYDRFYEGADEIYRIQEWEIVNGQWEDYSWIIRAPLAPAMADNIPEIEAASVVFGQESLEYQKGEDYIQAWTIYANTSFSMYFLIRYMPEIRQKTWFYPDKCLFRQSLLKKCLETGKLSDRNW